MYMYYYTKPHVMSWYIYHCEHLYTYHVHLNALPHVYLVLTYNDLATKSTERQTLSFQETT